MTDYNYDPELNSYVAKFPGVIDLSTEDSIRRFWQVYSLSTKHSKDCDHADVDWQDQCIPGARGNPDIRIRIYRPVKDVDGVLPAVFEIHGGGFVMGDLEMQHDWCQSLVRELNAVVVSIDYRLAPAHPYPAAPDDCYAGLCWLFENSASLGVDASRIAIAGQSAGACLALSTVLRARDQGGPQVCFQLLEIPVLDDRLQTASMQRFQDTPFWNTPNARWGWKHYLGEKEPHYYAAPARADDLSSLPPTYISTMEFDPLRDEGIEFALRLMQAGVSVELHAFPGTFHGSTLVKNAVVSMRCHRDVIESLSKHLAGSLSTC